MKIFLIGFMGCGKTTIANMLSYELKFPVIDLDITIEESQKMSIAKIFSRKGEEQFRKIESRELRKINDHEAIVACGGGTPCYHDNMDWINENGLSVYLKVKEQKLFERLSRVKNTRPMIAGMSDKQLKEFIRNKMKERETFYMQAKIIAALDEMSFDELLDELGLYLSF